MKITSINFLKKYRNETVCTVLTKCAFEHKLPYRIRKNDDFLHELLDYGET